MVVFAVSGAIVLAFVCWVMLRESPPSRASALQDGMDPGAQAIDHDAGDRCPNAVDQGDHEAGAQAAAEDAAYADELDHP